MWKSLIRLDFLKNEHERVGLVRLVSFFYFITFFVAIYKNGLKELSIVWVYLSIVFFVAVIGEKVYPYIIKGIQAWKGKE